VSEPIGWLATTIFAFSYFVRNPVTMRWVQAAAALCWMTYGILLHARPVIVANVIVAALAVYSSFRPVAHPQSTQP
jgi:uncharacterized protein with PQ loop repeat